MDTNDFMANVTCPRCGYKNNMQNTYCQACGCELHGNKKKRDTDKLLAIIIIIVAVLVLSAITLAFILRSRIIDPKEDQQPTEKPERTAVSLNTTEPPAPDTPIPAATPIKAATPAPVSGAASVPAATISPAATAAPVVTEAPAHASEPVSTHLPVSLHKDPFYDSSEQYAERHPQFNTYVDDMYNYSCIYPSHFENVSSEFEGYFAMMSPGGNALMMTRAFPYDGKTIFELYDGLCADLGGSSAGSTINNTDFTAYRNINETFGSFHAEIKNGYVYFLAFIYMSADENIYEYYFPQILNSFIVN